MRGVIHHPVSNITFVRYGRGSQADVRWQIQPAPSARRRYRGRAQRRDLIWAATLIAMVAAVAAARYVQAGSWVIGV